MLKIDTNLASLIILENCQSPDIIFPLAHSHFELSPLAYNTKSQQILLIGPPISVKK